MSKELFTVMTKITISLNNIPTMTSFYMPTRFSVWDKDALELKKSLDAIIPNIKVEEEHYRPRNAKLEKEAKRVSSNVTLPSTPPSDIAYVAMSSRVLYNSKLQNGEIRRGLYFTTKDMEVKLIDGAYTTSQMGRSQPEKVNDYGITCFLAIKGEISKREELQRNVETIIRTFYQN